MADRDKPLVPLRIPPSLQDYIIDNIRLGRQIGRGANGRILEAKWEGTEVAVKEIHSIFMNEVSEEEFQAFKQSFLRECEQSSRLRHPNIVRFFGIYRPPGTRVPSLVMELLHCSLTSLLEQTPVILIETKLSILHDVSLGVRYLHSRTPPIIHRDLSSNNVLLSKSMEAKIGDLGTLRLVDPAKQSQMTTAPGTMHFMPPEALAANPQSVRYGKELDVFSFGCVMLHTLSHQWPTPSEPVVTDPVTFEMKAQSEVERRSSYFDRIDRNRLGVLIHLIESCLSNLPKNRTSIVTLSEQLEGLVDRKHVPTVVSLQQEIERNKMEIQDKDAQIQGKNVEIQAIQVDLQQKDTEVEALKSELLKLQVGHPFNTQLQASNRSTTFFKNFKHMWKKCADLPLDGVVTSIAELDENVYVTIYGNGGGCCTPLMYDSNDNQWFILPKLPCWSFNLVVVPDRKQLLAIGGVVSTNDVVKVTNKVFQWNEENEMWLIEYPDMPTARCDSSCISHGSSVIVAGGQTGWDPVTMIRSVEVLHITDTDSHWSVVEQLPFATYEAVPLIVNDNLYIAAGFTNKCYGSTCNVVTASLPQLLQSSNTSIGQVWNKLPDMPYSSYSINHYQGCLITFTGDHLVEQPGEDKPVWKLVPLIHIYNPDTESWDCVGENPRGYHFGRSVHLKENKILFVGGLTGTHDPDKNEDIITSCMLLTLASQ